MDAFHTVMGGVLLLLHAPGVWILQRPPREPLPPRHCWPVRLPHRHRRSLLCSLSWHSLLPHCPRPQSHRHSVTLSSLFTLIFYYFFHHHNAKYGSYNLLNYIQLREVSILRWYTGLSALGCYLQGTTFIFSYPMWSYFVWVQQFHKNIWVAKFLLVFILLSHFIIYPFTTWHLSIFVKLFCKVACP